MRKDGIYWKLTELSCLIYNDIFKHIFTLFIIYLHFIPTADGGLEVSLLAAFEKDFGSPLLSPSTKIVDKVPEYQKE